MITNTFKHFTLCEVLDQRCIMFFFTASLSPFSFPSFYKFVKAFAFLHSLGTSHPYFPLTALHFALFWSSLLYLSVCLNRSLQKMSAKESSQVSSEAGISISQKQNSINRVVGTVKATESCETKGRNQVSCIPSTKKENKINKRNCINKVAAKKKRSGGGCGIRLPKRSEVSPVRFFKHLRRRMARGLCFAYFKKRRSATVSATVSSSGRSKPSVIPVDSHRSEAIEDCIEFINSSSSLPRSNSVSTNAS